MEMGEMGKRKRYTQLRQQMSNRRLTTRSATNYTEQQQGEAFSNAIQSTITVRVFQEQTCNKDDDKKLRVT